MKLESFTHVCKCTACKTAISSHIIHDELELKAATPFYIIHDESELKAAISLPIIHKELELEPSLKKEKKKNILNYEKMPRSWWYWDLYIFVTGALFFGGGVVGMHVPNPTYHKRLAGLGGYFSKNFCP